MMPSWFSSSLPWLVFSDDVVVKTPFSIWVQISSFSFFCAGNFSDLLIVRLCLLNAYIFLMINSLAGAPLWPHLSVPGKVFQVDGIIWATLNLLVHLSTVVRLLRDERQVVLSEDKLALWRMFYRTGGLSQMIFHETVAQHCSVVTVDQGTELDLQTYFYILYKGTVQVTLVEEEEEYNDTKGPKNTRQHTIISRRNAWSGQLFDFRALGMVQEQQTTNKETPQQHANKTRQFLQGVVVSTSGATLFQFSRADMPRIVQTPSSRLVWKELLTETLLNIVKRHFHNQPLKKTSNPRQQYSLQSCPSFYHNDQELFVSPLFAPLEEWETPAAWQAGSGSALKNPLAHIFAAMQRSFSPPWPFSNGPPTGLRHHALRATATPPIFKTPLMGGEGVNNSNGQQSNSDTQQSEQSGESTPLLSSSKIDSTSEATSVQEHDEEALLLGGMHLVDFVKFPNAH